MDWSSVGKIAASFSPMAGEILGGLIPFPGGAIIGRKFGEIIAKQFGVAPTPAAVSDAMANSTEETNRAKINAAIEEARIQVDGFKAIEQAYLHAVETGMQQTGATMRAEIGHEHWYYTGARPASLWVFNIVNLVFGMMLCWATGKTAWVSPDPLTVLANAWPLFAAYFGPLCLVNGVYINARSTEKRVAIENGVAMPNAAPAPKAGDVVKPASKITLLPPNPPNIPMPKNVIPPPPGSRP